MGYIKNDTNEIVVDAVLTKSGLQKIALDQPLNITRFALYDDEIDYALYNIDNPNGSDYFDTAISNLPLLEARIHDNNGDSATYGLFTKPPVPGAPTNTTFVLNVSIPTDFTTGIADGNISYAFTPSITPVPDDDRYVFYLVTITAKSSTTGLALPLSSVQLNGNADFSSGKIETVDLINLKQKIQAEQNAVGSPATPGVGSGTSTGGGSGTSGGTGGSNIPAGTTSEPSWLSPQLKGKGLYVFIGSGVENGTDYADVMFKSTGKQQRVYSNV